MECHTDLNNGEATPMTTRSEQEPPEDDWEQKHKEFLADPRYGFLEFFERLNQKIAASVAPGRKSWEEVSATDQFQQAFDFVTDRLLTVEMFQNVFEKHRDSGSKLALWEFMDNRVSLLLAEWTTKHSNKPNAVVKSDEHIQQHGGQRPPNSTQPTRSDFDALMQRITRLPEPHAASLLLFLWPLPTFPESWREKLLPLILNCGEKNGLSREEVKRRLDVVMARSEPVLTDEMFDREIRLGKHFEKNRLFDRKKRLFFSQLQSLSTRGEYFTQSGVDDELRCDCHESVKKGSEKDVLAQFADDDIYLKLPSGLRRVKNRPLWYRRRFSYCCYKQKYHRRCWLNASLELLVQKPVDGPMSYADISWVLNCPENTTAGNLSRARKTLLERSDSPEAEDALANLPQTEIKEAKARWKAELEPARLHAYVCDDLKPQVIQLSSKSNS